MTAEVDPRWAAVAAELTWVTPPTSIYEPEGRYGRWFGAGTLNAAVNCVDRHVDDRPAIHWEGEPGDRRTLTFRELADEVGALAAALRGLGVRPGDRVALHLGWLPEAVVAMLACARIGAPFSLIPVPLPVEALAERLDSLAPRVLLTQDGAWRHGTIIPTKSRVDDALTAAGGVEHTIVVRRTGLDITWYEGDHWLHDLIAPPRVPGAAPEPAPALPAEHPLLLSWLANRRGRPVLAVHGTATQLAAATALHRYGISPGGVFWCAGEISWLGAQVHGVLGPLAWGDTAVMFEGTLDVPNHRRLWDIIERYGVATLITTPSVLNRVRGWADAAPPESVRRTLRRVIAMAEPLDPDLRAWVADQLTGDPDAVADAWGQIELGAIVTVDSPADPGRLPDPGLAVVGAAGEPVDDGTPGEVVLRRPWAGTLRGVEGESGYDHWGLRPGAYSTGDRAIRHPGGRLEFLGRIDPDLRAWVADQLTGDPDAVADAWGQIELGAIVTVDSPADPGRLPDPGLAVVGAAGEPVDDGTPGEVVLRRPWAGTLRGVEGESGYDHWGLRPGAYSTGDRAIRHPGGRLEFLGRIDPVVSISGQLVSLAEIRDVLLDHPFLEAAEVVAVSDQRLGRWITACVVPVPGATVGPALAADLVATVRESLGGLARPRTVLFVDRFGDDLDDDARRRALEVVAASVGDRTAEITWAQVRAASTL